MDGKRWAIVGFFIATLGCSQSSNSDGGKSGGLAAVAASGSAAQSNPDQAVFDFLEAVRTGNDRLAAAMLTPLARQKTAEYELVVAPPGSPTAKFKVGKFE